MLVSIDNERLDTTPLSKMNININSLTFKTLVSGIYNKKLSSVIREICTNARDSHISAKNKDPFYITLNVDNNGHVTQISVKDYGTGLNKEEVEKYLCTLNSSSKRNTNDQIGYLGIGSKSPFAVTTSYVYICYKDGEKTDLTFYQYEHQTPHFDIESETYNVEEHPNSVECIIPLIDSYSLRESIGSIINQLVLFDIKPTLTINKSNQDLSITSEEILPEEIFPEVIEYENLYEIKYQNNSYYSLQQFEELNGQVSVGSILYSLVQSYYYNQYNFKNINLKYILKFNFNELTFNEGRENIVNVQSNILTITDKVQNLVEQLNYNKTEILNNISEFFNPDTLNNITFCPEYNRLYSNKEHVAIINYLDNESNRFGYIINRHPGLSRFITQLYLINNCNKYLFNNEENNFQLSMYFLNKLNNHLFPNSQVYYFYNENTTNINKIIYTTSSNIRKELDRSIINNDIDLNTIIVLVKTTSIVRPEQIKQRSQIFNNLIDKNLITNYLDSVEFKVSYNYLFQIFKKDTSKRVVSTSNNTSAGFKRGESIKILSYIDNATDPTEETKTLNQFYNLLNKEANDYYRHKLEYYLVPTEIINSDAQRIEFLENQSESGVSLKTCEFIFEYNNEDYDKIIGLFTKVNNSNFLFKFINLNKTAIDKEAYKPFTCVYKNYKEYCILNELFKREPLYHDKKYLNYFSYPDKLQGGFVNSLCETLIKLNSNVTSTPLRLTTKTCIFFINYYIKGEIKDYLEELVTGLIIDYKFTNTMQYYKDNIYEETE